MLREIGSDWRDFLHNNALGDFSTSSRPLDCAIAVFTDSTCSVGL
ncbi:hypothetical protein [Coleofasciculus sp. E2-BRE-01]